MESLTEYRAGLHAADEARIKQAAKASQLCRLIERFEDEARDAELEAQRLRQLRHRAAVRLCAAMREAGIERVCHGTSIFERVAYGDGDRATAIKVLRAADASELRLDRPADPEPEPESDTDGEVPRFTVEAEGGAPTIDGMKILAEIAAL